MKINVYSKEDKTGVSLFGKKIELDNEKEILS